jgi:transposase
MGKKHAKPPPSEERMQLRMQLLLEVMDGKITGVEAARRLGVSRKTWAEWQARGLAGLRHALSDRPSGRPMAYRDKEKEELRQVLENQQCQIQKLEATLAVTKTLKQLFEEEAAASKKKD